MIVVTTNWRIWLAGTAVSLLTFGIVFFTVIQPSMSTANQAVKSGLQQAQQAVNQAQKSFNSSTGAANATAGQAQQVSGQAQQVSGQAQQQVSNALKLTKCVAAAGADAASAQACEAKYSK